MNPGGCSNQAIGIAPRLLGCQTLPFDRNLVRDRQDSFAMLGPEDTRSFGQMASSPRIGFLLQGNSAHDLTERDDGEIDLRGINAPEPVHGLRGFPAGLRDDVRVDEVYSADPLQNPTGRLGAFSRVLMVSTSPSSQADPARRRSTIVGRDARSASWLSAERTTAARLPRKVTTCGTSLSRFLASCNCQSIATPHVRQQDLLARALQFGDKWHLDEVVLDQRQVALAHAPSMLTASFWTPSCKAVRVGAQRQGTATGDSPPPPFGKLTGPIQWVGGGSLGSEPDF